ncbi:hypothetical protein EON76_04355 [bacterium]|nr:MAG: hypothetical protein EON76_04355 [bacterium]
MYESNGLSEYNPSQRDSLVSLELRKKAMALCMAMSSVAVAGCSHAQEQAQNAPISDSERNRNDNNFTVTGLECNSDEITVSVTARGATYLRLENKENSEEEFALMNSSDAFIVASMGDHAQVSDRAIVSGDLAQTIAIKAIDFDPNKILRVRSSSEYGDTIDETINLMTDCKI